MWYELAIRKTKDKEIFISDDMLINEFTGSSILHFRQEMTLGLQII